jgi:spermidine synthase
MTALELRTTDAGAQRTEQIAQGTRFLCVLFFFSGFPALIYQLTWQRALFRIFGINIESVTIVVTAFMLGLGLGSLAGGLLSKRRGLPLLPLLAVIELATAVFGLASLWLFDQVGAWVMGLSLPATAAATLALVLIPTVLMGATLPVLVGHLVQRSGGVGSTLGLLYYVNTLGAGAACLACAVLLFPFVGMQGAVYVAVAINSAVAAGALIAHWHRGRTPIVAAAPLPVAAAASVAPRQMLAFGPVLVLAAAGGFVALAYEVFFFHTVSYATASSATAFAMTLGAFLIGLASGAREAGRNCAASTAERAVRRAAADLIWASAVGMLFLPLLDLFAWVDSGITGVAFVLVYLFARFWGSLLPYLAEFGIAADNRAGLRTALLYLANVLGSAAGSIVVGFVLADHLGLVSMAVALSLAGLACAMLLNVMLPVPHTPKMLQSAVAGALALLAIVALPHWSNEVVETLQWKGAVEAEPLVRVVENRSGIITVAADGRVFGNGIYDGRFNTDLKHDTNGIVRPYALSLFHPAPRDVLMIGLSSGSWAQVIANNPQVASLTVVEINPGYFTLIASEPEVASLLVNSKVSIVIDDGRRWLRANRGRRFDAIVSNTTFHFRANVTNLLSAEFLDLIKDHLNDGGVFFYNTTDSARVQRTGCLSFGEGARFINHMVVSSRPIRWDFARWRHTLEAYRIDGRPVFDTSRSEDRRQLDQLQSMSASFGVRNEPQIEPCRDVLARTAGKAPVTDDNMGSEWRIPLGLE